MKTVDDYTKGIRKEVLELYGVPDGKEFKRINKLLYYHGEATILFGDSPLTFNVIDNHIDVHSLSQVSTNTSDPFKPLESDVEFDLNMISYNSFSKEPFSDEIISESSEPEVIESERT